MIEPVGSQIQLNCLVNLGYTIRWNVFISELKTEISSDNFTIYGISIRAPDDSSSYLLINTTETNFVCYIDCEAFHITTLTGIRSPQVNVIIFGNF